MKIYLATATIEKTPYMGKSTPFVDQNIVLADTRDEAEEKYRAYWEAKDDPYSVSYHVYDLEIKEAIQ